IPGLFVLTKTLRRIADPSESRAHCKPERLSRLSKNIGSSVQNLRLLEGEVTCRARREHVSRDRRLGRNVAVQDQRVICVVNAERSIHDREQYLQLHAGGHARGIVRSRNGSQRRGEAKSFLASTVETGIQSRASEWSSVQVCQVFRSELQLVRQRNEVHAEVVEGSKRDVRNDWNAVLDVAIEAGVAAGIDNCFCRNGNLNSASARIRRIERNEAPIRILQRNGHAIRDENVRRDGSDIKAAKIVLAAHVEAFVRRSDFARISSNERAGHPEAQRIASLIHGHPVLVFNDRANGIDVATKAGELSAYKQAGTTMRLIRTVDGIEGEARGDLAGDDALQ